MSDKNRKGDGKKGNDPAKVRFVTEYINKRTGKLMRAADYGYKAWPFGGGRKKA